MTDAMIIDMGRQVLIVTLKVALPVLLVALITGVVISIFQAVTQIQEMTLTFIPKILVVALVLAVAGMWMLGEMRTFAVGLFHDIPHLTRQIIQQ